jgi:hypothetical protein
VPSITLSTTAPWTCLLPCRHGTGGKKGESRALVCWRSPFRSLIRTRNTHSLLTDVDTIREKITPVCTSCLRSDSQAREMHKAMQMMEEGTPHGERGEEGCGALWAEEGNEVEDSNRSPKRRVLDSQFCCKPGSLKPLKLPSHRSRGWTSDIMVCQGCADSSHCWSYGKCLVPLACASLCPTCASVFVLTQHLPSCENTSQLGFGPALLVCESSLTLSR